MPGGWGPVGCGAIGPAGGGACGCWPWAVRDLEARTRKKTARPIRPIAAAAGVRLWRKKFGAGIKRTNSTDYAAYDGADGGPGRARGRSGRGRGVARVASGCALRRGRRRGARGCGRARTGRGTGGHAGGEGRVVDGIQRRRYIAEVACVAAVLWIQIRDGGASGVVFTGAGSRPELASPLLAQPLFLALGIKFQTYHHKVDEASAVEPCAELACGRHTVGTLHLAPQQPATLARVLTTQVAVPGQVIGLSMRFSVLA